MRSTFGRARVTQTVRPCLSSGGILAVGTSGKLGLAPTFEAVLEPVRRHAGMAQPGRHALAELGAFLADHDRGAAARIPVPNPDGSACGRRIELGISRGIGVEILLGPDIDQDRAMRRADQARKLVDGDRVD